MTIKAGYLKLYKSGELQNRAKNAEKLLEKCNICPHDCKVNRLNSQIGFCFSQYLPIVSSYTPHFGEEPALSGKNGVGNIFFGNCNLRCIYCQNYEISQNWKVECYNEITFERLADIMIELQNKGCHSIGLVSPTHFVPQILISLVIAVEKGLNIPLVYNSNGYDSVETLKLLNGVVDIYLPDIKYGNNIYAKNYSGILNYFDNVKAVLKEMYKQVGSKLLLDDDGIVQKGLIIRHLVLPNDLSESEEVLKFIAKDLNPDITVSIMSQYFPTHKADKEILLTRPIRESEYLNVIELLEKYGLKNGWVQELESKNNYKPDFNKDRLDPFGNNETLG